MKSFVPRGDGNAFRFVNGDQPPGETDGICPIELIPYKISEMTEGTMDEALTGLTDALTVLFTTIHTQGSPSNRILTQAFNDVVDLVSDIRSGRGRPSALLARTLFEHLVNYCTVENDPAAAARYLASEAVAENLMFDNLDWMSNRFDLPSEAPDPELRAAASSRLNSVIQQHGAQIRSKTFTQNLFKRAQDAGYEEDYEGYRLLSQAVHGAAGGAEGLSVKYEEAPIVHRLGPSLRLAPLAYRWGFSWFRALLTELSKRRPELATAKTLQALNDVLAITADYFLATQQLDKDIQPKGQPRDPRVLGLVVLRRGRPKWYAFYPHLNLVTLAVEPEQGAAVLEDLVQHFDSIDALLTSAGRDISILTDLTVDQIGTAALPAHGLLAHDPSKNLYDFDFIREPDGTWLWNGSNNGNGRKWGPAPGEVRRSS